MSRGGAIVGWGSALPDKVVTNLDLEATLDTSDAWIVERTGIKERRLGGETATLAVEAGRAALERAGLAPAEIDLLILSTSTPDKEVPASSSDVHYRLGAGGGAFDLNAACAGFVYALVVANSMIASGVERALVIGSDALSRIIDPSDRTTAILFADGAGALVLEAAPGEGPLLSWDLGVDGSALPLLYCERNSYLYMEGQEVFRRAVRVMVESASTTLERAKLGPEDVALIVPHQANLRIIEAANKRIGIPMERTALCLEKTGNTSSASIPLALCEAAEQGRLRPGDNVLLTGFGAGMTWASAIVRWGP